MIFWIGFTIMFLNEGFVMMRHVSPWAAKQRDNLIEKYGDGWQTFHGIVDYVWVIVTALGFAFSPHRGSHLYVFLAFWGSAFTLYTYRCGYLKLINSYVLESYNE